MGDSFVVSIAAVVALLPAAILALRKERAPDGLFWLLLAVAVAGPLVQTVTLFSAGWQTGFAAAVWITVAASVAIFATIAAATRKAWPLASILLPYLMILGVLAIALRDGPAAVAAPTGWVVAHIVLSVITYGLLTIAAVAGLAVFLQERALKAKSAGALTRVLPSMADAETIQVRLLAACLVILGCGVITGMSAQYVHDGRLLNLDHKTVFSLIAFAVIGALLAAHYKTGVRGRRAARFVLLAYLLLTLAYPGVKFVTDVVLG